MNTLEMWSNKTFAVPAATAWSLTDLGEAIGKQALFTKQSPQKLKALREHALIESAVSSNRIEGVEVDQKRIGTLMFGKSALRDRDEEEVRGYRDALNLIHSRGRKLPVTEKTIRELHRVSRSAGAGSWDAGKYKKQDGDIIERYADGRSRVRFKPTSAKETPKAMKRLVKTWNQVLDDRRIPPLLALAAFNLDFLCIHPFRDGNGRASRLLMLLQSQHLGLDVGRYVSLERTIEQNKERYYETLHASSVGWHDAKHNPWKYVDFALFIFKEAYREFESRVGQTAEPKGAKAELVRSAIHAQNSPFRLVDIEKDCPSVGRDWIRIVLREMKSNGEIRSLGRGPGAQWEKILNKRTTLK